MMTDEQLCDMISAELATTPGPWHCEHFPDSICQWDVTHGPADDAPERFSITDDFTEADARFIASVKQWIPELLKMIAELRLRITKMEKKSHPTYPPMTWTAGQNDYD